MFLQNKKWNQNWAPLEQCLIQLRQSRPGRSFWTSVGFSSNLFSSVWKGVGEGGIGGGGLWFDIEIRYFCKLQLQNRIYIFFFPNYELEFFYKEKQLATMYVLWQSVSFFLTIWGVIIVFENLVGTMFF